MLHRLNRTEYAREVENLLGLEVDARGAAAARTPRRRLRQRRQRAAVSPSFLDQYIVAAQRSEHAGGRRAERRARERRVSHAAGTSQARHIEGLPLGTRGGMLVEHLFPADGEYTFNVNQSGGFGGGYIAGLDSRTGGHDDRRPEGVRARSSVARKT